MTRTLFDHGVAVDVDHGFHSGDCPSYNAKAASDGWQRLTNWFQQNGVT